MATAQHDEAEFDRAFARQTLISERRRVIAILILLTLLLLSWLVTYAIWSDTMQRISQGRARLWSPFTRRWCCWS
jgi:hypothetical protein